MTEPVTAQVEAAGTLVMTDPETVQMSGPPDDATVIDALASERVPFDPFAVSSTANVPTSPEARVCDVPSVVDPEGVPSRNTM